MQYKALLTLNRTKVELKPKRIDRVCRTTKTLNRTKVELKR